MRFTREEFDSMVNELLYSENVSFDALSRITEKTLRTVVFNWCKDDEHLCGRGFEDEIMQRIHMRLMKKTVSHFLKHKNVKGPYNNNPEGFEDWLFTVGKNITKDFAEEVRCYDFFNKKIDFVPPPVTIEDSNNKQERRETLQKAFSIVLDSDIGIYKILTWLAQCIFILDVDVTKIKSNELIIAAFEDKNLYEMYDMILTASKRISWIVISEQQNEKILEALRKKTANDISYGETKYRDFFMKHNGEVSGKKSISDWVNRINNMIKKQMNPGVEKPKKSTGKKTDKTINENRREENGTSDN